VGFSTVLISGEVWIPDGPVKYRFSGSSEAQFTKYRKFIVGSSGVAGPLAARGGGQICRPFVLGFGNWRACLKYKSML